MAFSRGLYPAWFHGINNQELAHARFGKKWGVFLGRVARVERDRVLLRPDKREEGGRVYLMDRRGDLMSLAFGPAAVDFTSVQPGQLLWPTNAPALDRELRKTFEGDAPKFTRPVSYETHGHVGVPLTLPPVAPPFGLFLNRRTTASAVSRRLHRTLS